MDVVSNMAQQDGWSSSISFWTYYSHNHIYSAFYFSKLSEKIEKLYQDERKNSDTRLRNEVFDKYFHQHRACVTSAIFSAVAFMEATINEIFSEAADFPDGYYAKQLSPDVRYLMSKMWRSETKKPNSDLTNSYNFIEKYSILDKFKIALSLAEKSALDFGKSPCQDIKKLIEIRNVLMHYKPQMIVSYSTIESIEVTKKIPGLNFNQLEAEKKFPENILFEKGNPYFPDRCLGCGCAQWAAASSFDFVKEFYSVLGISAHSCLDTFRANATSAATYL